jgi:nucleoside-diphosphate-sugar epimerase
MRIAVTGGSGNVGRTTCATLHEAGYEVRVVDTRPPEDATLEFVEASVTEPKAMLEALDGTSGVVHLAAIPSFQPDRAPHEYMRVNVEGTFNVCEAAGRLGLESVVVASSDSALGFVFKTHPAEPEYLPIDETHPLRPQDPYGLSKLLAEEVGQAASRRHRVHVTSLRFCWVWFEDTYRHVTAFQNADPGDFAGQLWGYVDVRDAARACRLALERRGPLYDVFYITGPDTFSSLPSLELAKSYLPNTTELGDDFVREPYAAFFDTGKARKLLGYMAHHTWRSQA